MATFFEDIKRYVGFGAGDTEALRGFLPSAEPHLPRIAESFYDVIQRHPRAHRVLEGPEQIERLKRTLTEWMRSGLEGPHDEAFHEVRKRIGRVHVQIDLPQQYMFTAMNVIRLRLRALAEEAYAGAPAERRRVSDALDKLLDLELAIMLDTYREDSDARLRRKERLAAIGQFAASVAHDLRNPLGVIESSVYLLNKKLGEDEWTARHIGRIEQHVKMSGTIISNLLEMARHRRARTAPFRVDALFDQALLQVPLPPGVAVEREIADGLEIDAEAGILVQALANLIENAVAAQGSRSGAITLRARRLDGGRVAIEVADRGPGFDADVLPDAFEPLVTTRGGGVGLGLALVKNIAERHSGDVEAANRPEGGAIVRILLPAPEAST